MEDDVVDEIIDMPVTLPVPEPSESQEVYTQEGLDEILSRSNGQYTSEWIAYAAKKQKQEERVEQAGGYENILQEREIRAIKGYATGGLASLKKW